MTGRKSRLMGPTFKSTRIRRNRIEVSFDQPLKTNNGKSPDWFRVSGRDGEFYPAEAVIQGDKVILRSPFVFQPVEVRFGWHEAAQPNLINADSLPARPFKTDQLHFSLAKSGW